MTRITYNYYQQKLVAEEIIKSSGVPHTILRATQFHSLVDFLMAKAAHVPVVPSFAFTFMTA